jgi:isoprenylcysteine carboxyl methyltransferase (ICMT) family protein YpbQ
MGPFWIFGVPTVLTLAAFIYDTWRNRKVNWMFAIGSAVLIASFPLRMMIGGTDAWLRLAAWMTN